MRLPPILDPACGSKMFYRDKSDERVLFGDMRQEDRELCDGRRLIINPDVQLDFRCLPFFADTFHLVIFDPPHLRRLGKKSWLALKYGALGTDWREDLHCGFAECFRVLKPNGTLCFKWSEKDIPLKDVLALTPEKPVIGHMGRVKYPFHWLLFIKAEAGK